MKEKLQQMLSAIALKLKSIKFLKSSATAQSHPLAGSLGKTESSKKSWNWIENIIYWWIKKIQKMIFSKNKSVKECRFSYSVSDIRKANDDIINGKTATTKGRNSVIKKKYSASEMNEAWLKITSK